MTMVYEITDAGNERVHVDARPHGKEEDAKGVFYNESPEYIRGYLAGVVAAEDYEIDGDLDENDNRVELLAALIEYLKSNPVEVPA